MGIKLPSTELGSKPSPLDLSDKNQIYDYDYYSGVNVSIYIGDVLIDEINHLRFTLEQSKKPVYGYSSYNWNFMAKGTTIVHGSFTINFKESGYLYYILDHVNKNSSIDPVTGEPLLGAPKQSADDKILRRNIERIHGPNNNASPSAYDLYNDLASLDDKEFENVAETFEDVVWGGGSRSMEQIARTERRPDYKPQFDIYLTYGNLEDPSANHTVKRITGVELVTIGQMIEISGEPIQEAYSFMARDVL